MRRIQDAGRVSVIIPTYNLCRMLPLTIESLLSQTYSAVETIVVDDGSTDDTPGVMKQYAGRVVYVRQQNQSVAAARNAGIRASTGEYLAFLDHDDLLLPHKIERQVRFLTAHPGTAFVHCRYFTVDEHGRVIRKVGLLPQGDALQELLYSNFVWVGAPLIRRQCLEHVGLFDGTLSWSSDWDMWLRIARAGYRFGCIQEPLGCYRVMQGSMMSNVPKLEQASIAVLGKAFGDPALPAAMRASRDRCFGHRRLWLAWTYYGVERWDDAQRNLEEALVLVPELAERPEALANELLGHVLNPRIDDPFKFVANVLSRLPPSLAALREKEPWIASQMRLRLSLQDFARGDEVEAKCQLQEALVLDPSLGTISGDLSRLLADSAISLPVGDPLAAVDAVLENLPPEAQLLRDARSELRSQVRIGMAFEDYSAGRRQLAIGRILAAVRDRPAWLWNRGILSVLVKSLVGILRGVEG